MTTRSAPDPRELTTIEARSLSPCVPAELPHLRLVQQHLQPFSHICSLYLASCLQQEIAQHHPRFEIAGIDDQCALDQRHGFIGSPDGDEEEGDRVELNRPEHDGLVHQGAIVALGWRPSRVS